MGENEMCPVVKSRVDCFGGESEPRQVRVGRKFYELETRSNYNLNQSVTFPSVFSQFSQLQRRSLVMIYRIF